MQNIIDDNPEKDINDVFTDILLSEENLMQQAYKEGYQKGASEGNTEGFHLGYHRGAELGVEIGYYSGVVESYIDFFKQNQTSEKVTKTLQSLTSLISCFPRENDINIDIISLTDNIRAKFKKLCALLKVNLFYKTDQLSF